jgi:hypothetical protein
MAVPTRYLLQQRSVIGALGLTALEGLKQSLGKGSRPKGPVVAPGPERSRIVQPPSAELVRDYVRHVGGDPGSYRGTLPPHLFPQWGFPLAARTLDGLPYPVVRAVNGGCRLQIEGPLPAGKPLSVSARLENVDDDGRRVVLKQRLVTSLKDQPPVLVAELYAIIVLGSGGSSKSSKGQKAPAKPNGKPAPAAKAAPASGKDRPVAPLGAREIACWKLRLNAGLDFAKLTGDVNPIHWLAPYARASGFPNVILHGFGTMARVCEGLNRAVFAGDVTGLKELDVRFVKPLVLPHEVRLFLEGNQFFVADAPGAPAYAVGTFQARGQS